MPPKKTPTARAYERNYRRALRGQRIDRNLIARCFECGAKGVLADTLFYRWPKPHGAQDHQYRPRNLLCQGCFGDYVDEEIEEAVKANPKHYFNRTPKKAAPYVPPELPDEPDF